MSASQHKNRFSKSGGIYCHDAGDRLHVQYGYIFETHQQPSVGVQRVPKYLQAEILLIRYLFGCHREEVMEGKHIKGK